MASAGKRGRSGVLGPVRRGRKCIVGGATEGYGDGIASRYGVR